MKSYRGKLLWVDLTTQTVQEEAIPESWMREFIGGEGFVIKLLYDRLPAKIDPLSPENLLIFASGPLNGSMAPSSGRMAVGFKSPLSGTCSSASVGGHFVPAMKKTGYDVLVVQGKAATPTYLHITPNGVEFKDASHLWGQEVAVTEERIREELGNKKVRIAEIGVGGEKLTRFAAVMIDGHRAAGRGGAGAVMGSKNLKAIAVDGSLDGLELHDTPTFKEQCRIARQDLKDEPFVGQLLSKFGTPAFVAGINATGTFPTRNWQKTTFDQAEAISHEAYHKTLKVEAEACHACPIACGRKTEILDGPYKGQKGYGPEYEGLGNLGAKTDIADLNSITMAYYLCDRYGLDIISVGQVIASAMEWYERGIIDSTVTDGIDLRFGNAEALVQMTEKIGKREGFGNVLAEGVKRAAEIVGKGAEEYAMHVKGMEMAACGVRASKGEALAHMASERGADHMRPYASTVDAYGYIAPELGIHEKKSPTQDGDKAWVKALKEYSMISNMLGTCLFTTVTMAVKGSTWTNILNAATGLNLTFAELMQCAERVINLEKLFILREGFTRKDDTLPKRLLTEPAPDGVGKGQVVNQDVILDEYYAAMGWDVKTGVPTLAKLKELGLEAYAPKG